MAISAGARVAALKNVDFPTLGFPTSPNSFDRDFLIPCEDNSARLTLFPSELIRILAGNELVSLDCGCCYYSNFDVLKIFNILISSLFFILLLEPVVPIGRAELEVREFKSRQACQNN